MSIETLFSNSPLDRRIGIDFETRSAMDLKACGAHRYARHPSTDVMIAVFRFSQWESYRWHPGEQLPERVLAAIHDESVTWHAWNAAFEIVIWKHQMAGKYGFPELPIERWSCTMVRALMTGLPGQLEKAAPAMGLPEEFWKDDEGSKVMKRVSKPRKKVALGEEPASWHKEPGFQDTLTRYDSMGQLWLGRDPWKAAVSACGEFTIYCDPDTGEEWVARWWNDMERLTTLYDYCDQDTLAEWMIGERIAPMSPVELEAWHMDQRINHRGYRIDTDFVRVAQQVSDEALVVANEEAWHLSMGCVTSLTKPAEVRDWINSGLSELGYSPIDGIGKEVLIVLRAQLQQDLQGACPLSAPLIGSIIRMIDLRLNEAKTSTKKLNSMLNAADTDDQRVRGGLQFAGAGRTARWAGRLVQPHNFPRPEKWASGGAAVEQLIDIIRNDETVWMRLTYGGIGVVISSMLRPCIAAAEGNVLTAADFNAIEMRFSAWLTDCEMILGALNRGEDVYRMMAAKVFGVANWQDIPKDSFERMLGKRIILGCGYQMWVDKFWQSCRDEGLTIDRSLAESAVKTYRAENHEIKAAWKQLENAAVRAVQSGQRVSCLKGKIAFYMNGKNLHCVLPSGRELVYLRAYIKPEMKFGREVATVCFYGWNSERHRMEWQSMYGGRWLENCQAEGTEVLCKRGWVQIENIRDDDLVHDGVEFVRHSGLIAKGTQPCMTLDGVQMTPDHLVLADDETWNPASSNPRPFRPDIRPVDLPTPDHQRRAETEMGPALSMRGRGGSGGHRRGEGREAWQDPSLRHLLARAAIRKAKAAWHECASRLLGVAVNARSMSFAHTSRMGELRWEGHYGLRSVGAFFRSLLAGHGSRIPAGADAGSERQQWPVQSWELPMGGRPYTGRESTGVAPSGHRQGRRIDGGVPDHDVQSMVCRPVYDILNAGPRSRFVVRGATGPMIVHNCTQAGSRDVLRDAMMRLDRAGYSLTMSIHDEVVCEDLVGSYSVKDMESVMELIPEWAPGLPLKVEGWQGQRYRK